MRDRFLTKAEKCRDTGLANASDAREELAISKVAWPRKVVFYQHTIFNVGNGLLVIRVAEVGR